MLIYLKSELIFIDHKIEIEFIIRSEKESAIFAAEKEVQRSITFSIREVEKISAKKFVNELLHLRKACVF